MSRICKFNTGNFSFEGTPVDQARCLLRKVLPLGNVGDTAVVLPTLLEDLIGKAVDISTASFADFLSEQGISEEDIGGALTDPLSRTDGEDGPVKRASYFVIHDTSTQLSENKRFKKSEVKFPTKVDTAEWSGNDLSDAADVIAHVVINRLGESRTSRDYKRGRRATKRERLFVPGNPDATVGLFLHHELVQPRLNNTRGIDEFSPDPGFTEPQYDRLAVCYAASAIRGGSWLIPLFHGVLDLDIPDAHDDPQHFDLDAWAGAIERLRSKVLGTPLTIPAPENPILTSPLFRGNAVLEAVAEGHLVLQASGRKVDGMGPVQDALNTLGFPINLGSSNQFRGFFGEKTQAALVAFQQATPGILQPAGVVDQDTVKALDAALLTHGVAPEPPETPEDIKLLTKGKVVATLKEKPGGSGSLRSVDIMQLAGRAGFYYKAAMAIDVDGSPRAYTKDATSPKPLDSLKSVDSEGIETMYIQQRSKTVRGVTHVGEGPFKDFFVSRTSLLFNKGDAFKTSNFVDAEMIPYIVFPHGQSEPAVFSGVSLGDVAYVIDLKTGRSTHAIFADTNPKVGEASVRVASNLGRSDLNAGNGEEDDRFLYILFPGSKFTPEPTVPHWPDTKIKEVADKAFATWGGMDQVRTLFPKA